MVRMMRPLFVIALFALASCHNLRADDKPQSPHEMCRLCCQQALDACRLDTDAFPAARCQPKLRECNVACDAGDENEMCVIQTNRELAAAAPKQLPPPVATAHAEPGAHGACDDEGTWKLTVETAHGETAGCTSIESIPKQVSFRIER